MSKHGPALPHPPGSQSMAPCAGRAILLAPTLSVLHLGLQEAAAAVHELPDGQRLVVQPEQAWALGDLLLDPGPAGAASTPLPDCLASACASLPDPTARKVTIRLALVLAHVGALAETGTGCECAHERDQPLAGLARRISSWQGVASVQWQGLHWEQWTQTGFALVA